MHGSPWHSLNLVKNGKTANKKQKYRCKEGGQEFITNSRYQGCRPFIRALILNLTLNSSGIRDIARVLQISTNTVQKRLRDEARNRPAVRVPTHAKTVALDEFWSFVGSNSRQRWTWLAITDLVFWRASTGEWVIRPSSGKLPVKSTPGLTDERNRAFIVQLGLPGDLPIGSMDLNGDGTSEIVVWRPTNGSYYAINSGANLQGMTFVGTTPDGNSYSVQQFGLPGDVPVTVAIDIKEMIFPIES